MIILLSICIGLFLQNAKLHIWHKSGNVLIIGRTDCGKIYFTQKLAVNKFFGKLKRVEWVLYINLDKGREAEIESCFSCDVDFHYLKSTE